MKGLINYHVGTWCLASGLALLGGCDCYRNLVDPCWPERYSYAARQEVMQGFAPQVNNGHILDQTVWNYHFETGSEKLTPGGLQHLANLARRRPCPDPTIYLQTAQDVAYDPEAPEKLSEARTALDGRRIQSIQKYLTAQTSDRPVPFEVAVHDPKGVGQSAIEANNAVMARNMTAFMVNQSVMQSAPGGFPGVSAGSPGSGGGGGGGGK